MEKTYKRETAWILLIILMIFHTWGIWSYEAATTAEFLTTYIFIFTGGAFGLDAFAKQIQRKGEG